MTNVSYQRLLNYIEAFASAHLMVKKFGADFEPQMPNFATKDEAYPVLYVTPISSLLEMNQTNFTVYAYCWDIIQKDRANITTILSDTHQILSDLDIWMRNGNIDDIDVLDNSSIEPLNNGLLDYCAGWRMTITFNCSNYSICEIPFDSTGGQYLPSYLYPAKGPTDIYTTGATYNSGTTTLSLYRNDGFVINVTGITAGGGTNQDIYTTGGTYANGTAVFTNNTGGTFSVSGFYTGNSITQGITGATNGTGISTSLTNNNLTITNTAPDQTVSITGGTNIQINGSYPNFGVNFTGSTVDTYVTGFTYSNNTLTINQNEGKNPLSVVVNTMTGLTVNGRITTDNILFNTGYTSIQQYGQVHWNDTYKTLEIDTDISGVQIKTGLQNVVRVVNKTLSTITKGKVVYINGNQGNRPTIALADYSGETTSSGTLGLVMADIANNDEGFVLTFGIFEGYDTSNFGTTDTLYLYTAGTITNVVPTPPNHAVRLGKPLNTTNNGKLQIQVQNGYELQELHNVLITTPTAGQVLKYDGTLWVNSSDITITGGTYTNGTATFTNNTGGTFNITGFYTGNSITQGITGATNGNGISTSLTNNNLTITNTQTQGLTGSTNGSGISTSIANNNITITNTQTQGITGATNGSGISTSLTNNNLTITNTQVQGITGLTAGNNINISGSNNSYTISFTGTTGSNFTGGTVSGATTFTNGLYTNVISATTYQNLPTIQAVTNVFGTSLTATSSFSHYVFSGSSASQTLTLPTLAGNTNVRIAVKNRGSAVLAVSSQSASQIYTYQTNTTIYLNVGEAFEFINDGTYWIVL